ncbi:MAG: thiamine pyrophosphate-binding protein, partial [Acidimicrobiales bacterium]
MTGGEALAQSLLAEGVRVVFGVPGVQLDFALDGIAQLGGRLPFWNTRHEQGASYMADGFARGGGGIGVCMVVPGPGLLNAAAGLATAYACSSPVLVLVGQLPLAGIGKGYGLLHEVPEQSRILASLTKWSAMVRSPEEVPAMVRRAVHELRSGRPRPVGLELPLDVLASRARMEFVAPPEDDADLVEPSPADIAAAASLLSRAECPVIVAGGGVRAGGATAELQALAEALGAPVAMTRNGRGALSDRHPLAVGPLGLPRVLAQADVVLVVGSRFVSHNGTALTVPPGAKVVLFNVDPDDLGAPRRPEVVVLGDASRALTALGAELGPARSRPGGGKELAAAVRQAYHNELAAVAPQMAYVDALRRAIPEDGVLVNELTQVGYVAGLAYPVW